MTEFLNGVASCTLVGEKIVKVEYGNKLTPGCGSYGAYTFTMASGKKFVIWTGHNEVNFGEVVTK